jgi:BirA family biotin operon repressor/biotin-[acetyl-CoA-carboxylase] ligase
LLPIATKNKIGQPFIQFDTIASTNSYAIDKIQANLAAHGTTYFAHQQTEGKGQRGKKWHTENGANIILSVIVDCSLLSIQHQFKLSAAVALACYDFFSQYAGDETSIKWPNDIYWRDRKAAGILIENIVRGSNWTYAVIGIGMNINQTNFSAEAKNPVSLKQITGKNFDIIAMAKQLLGCLEKRYEQVITSDFKNVLADYNTNLYKAKQQVSLKKGSAVLKCIIDGVNEHGQLIVNGAAQESFDFGEVEWVI